MFQSSLASSLNSRFHLCAAADTSEAAHRCVYSKGDEEGKMGIELSKDITTIAAVSCAASPCCSQVAA